MYFIAPPPFGEWRTVLEHTVRRAHGHICLGILYLVIAVLSMTSRAALSSVYKKGWETPAFSLFIVRLPVHHEAIKSIPSRIIFA